MTKPAPSLTPDPDIGPLDEHGQQIWSPEEEAAIARLDDDPARAAALDRSDAQIDRGECYTPEEVRAWMIERKKEWFAAKGLTPPPGYFAS